MSDEQMETSANATMTNEEVKTEAMKALCKFTDDLRAKFKKQLEKTGCTKTESDLHVREYMKNIWPTIEDMLDLKKILRKEAAANGTPIPTSNELTSKDIKELQNMPNVIQAVLKCTLENNNKKGGTMTNECMQRFTEMVGDYVMKKWEEHRNKMKPIREEAIEQEAIELHASETFSEDTEPRKDARHTLNEIAEKRSRERGMDLRQDEDRHDRRCLSQDREYDQYSRDGRTSRDMDYRSSRPSASEYSERSRSRSERSRSPRKRSKEERPKPMKNGKVMRMGRHPSANRAERETATSLEAALQRRARKHIESLKLYYITPNGGKLKAKDVDGEPEHNWKRKVVYKEKLESEEYVQKDLMQRYEDEEFKDGEYADIIKLHVQKPKEPRESSSSDSSDGDD